MSQHRIQAWVAGPLVACLLAATTSMIAAETPAVNDDAKADQSQNTRSQNIDVEKLRKQIADQQKQIDAMQKTLAEQQRLLEAAATAEKMEVAAPAPSMAVPSTRAPLGEVASTSPMIPMGPAAAAMADKDAEKASPLQFNIGNITIMPVGFMDLTGVWRDKNAGSGIGELRQRSLQQRHSGAKLSEFRFSPQNSPARLPHRRQLEGRALHRLQRIRLPRHQRHQQPRRHQRRLRAPPPPVLGGRPQGQVGISGRPELEHADPQPQGHLGAAGRPLLQPGDRRELHGRPAPGPASRASASSIHPSDKVTFGLSLENPNQYIGGSGGGPSDHAAFRLGGSGRRAVGQRVHQPADHTQPDARHHRQAGVRPELTRALRDRGHRADLQDWNTTTASRLGPVFHQSRRRRIAQRQFRNREGLPPDHQQLSGAMAAAAISSATRPTWWCAPMAASARFTPAASWKALNTRPRRSSCCMPTTAASTSAATWPSTPTAPA